MIKKYNNIFLINTRNTTYMFSVLKTGHVEHLYYGKRLFSDEISNKEDIVRQTAEALREKREFAPGNTIVYSKDAQDTALEDICLEMSSYGKGDVREPFIELIHDDGTSTSDFLYSTAEIKESSHRNETLPGSYGETEALELKLKEKEYDLELVITYAVFEECDVITRSARLINNSAVPVVVKRLMSTQLDMYGTGLRFTMFHGHWAREMMKDDVVLKAGNIINSSMTGTSGNRANPLVMISYDDTGENSGRCYAMNLIYSGNHYESLSVSGFGKTRFVSGINPDGFSWELEAGYVFEAPEAVMTFSDEGMNGASCNMHLFVSGHIIRGKWQKKERPVLINSWEASYFRFNEASLLRLAEKAKKAGIELFVLDDGWFGKRDDDTCSLGDWKENTKKLPGGLRGLSEKINSLGMMFGIWVEPEMINEDSDLYRAHPDWAVKIPGHEQSLGRNQMILDLTRQDVRENILNQMKYVLNSGNITYVKWDMNRIFSDTSSAGSGRMSQGEFLHRYICGLYQIMDTLTKDFPDVLFEGCASGGNRFDLGILSYFPQIWGSDDTDAIMRSIIQRGYSYGYPQSAVGSHVSACPNHQTMRNTPIETRFDVAACGALGYELNLNEISDRDFKAVTEQVEFYKKWRKVFQFGSFYRIEDNRWMIVSGDKKRAIGVMIKRELEPNTFFDEFKTKGLDDLLIYNVTCRAADHEIAEFGSLINNVAPVHIRQDGFLHHAVGHFMKIKAETENVTVPGSVLNNCGLRLKQSYGGTGINDNVRVMKDNDSRMYLFEALE